MPIVGQPINPLPAVAQRVADARDADIYFFAGDIEPNNAVRFRECVVGTAKSKNALLLLTTFGGSGDAAYQMARCLQAKYPNGVVAVLVGQYCKSAGTLVTLGANQLVMGELAELGPLDVQITKPDTLGERTSGLTPSQSLLTLRMEAFACFEKFFLDILSSSGYAITTKTSALIAAKMTTGLYRPVYAQIDPMRLGEFQRATEIAMEYGKRLDSWAKNLKEKSLGRLVKGYPSHEFVIDRKEADLLFNCVAYPTEDESNLSALLQADAMKAAMGGPRNAVIRHLGAANQNGSGIPGHSSGERARPSRSGRSAPRDGRPNS